jgi:hypothetical protein
MTHEVLKQMVKALECALSEDKPYIDECKQAIQAGKHAIAELESQEPVAVKRMKEWVEFLKRQSDNGQHMNIPSGLSAGTCWEIAIELEQFINTTPPQRTEQNFCSRCGKRTKDLTTIHTCTPPQD